MTWPFPIRHVPHLSGSGRGVERRASYAGTNDGQETRNKNYSLSYVEQRLRGKGAMVIWHHNIRRVTPRRSLRKREKVRDATLSKGGRRI